MAYTVVAASNNYLSVPHPSVMDVTTGDFTWMAWIKLTSHTANRQIWFLNLGQNAGGFECQINSTGKLRAYIGPGGTDLIDGNTALVDGTYAHLAVTRISGAVVVYLNGVSDATATLSGSVAGGSNALLIGSDSSTEPGDMAISDFRFYNFGLSAAQVNTEKNLVRPKYGPVLWFPFAESTGSITAATTITDYSNRSRVGTFTNSGASYTANPTGVSGGAPA